MRRVLRFGAVATMTAALAACAGAGAVPRGAPDEADRREPDAADKPDLSTPQSAAAAWVRASGRGEAAAVQKILVDDEEQRAFFDGPLRFTAAVRRLQAAGLDRFGEAGKGVTGYPSEEETSSAEKLDVRVDGDRAIVRHPDAAVPLHLRRVDGRWRVDLSRNMKDPRVVRAAERAKAVADVADAITAEIKAGKFATAEEAREAFAARRKAGTSQKDKPH